MNHAMKITMTLGLIATGVYQYYRITGEKKKKAAAAAERGGAAGVRGGGRVQ